MSHQKKIVSRYEELPTGLTEAEEDRFWDEHELGGELLEEMRPLHERPLDDLDPQAAERR